MQNSILIYTPTLWNDYELIDSGNGMKLERFGSYTVARPDPRAIWNQLATQQIWSHADAAYVRTTKEEGQWDIATPPPQNWQISYKKIMLKLKPTSFKHVGVFPEQAVNWDWMMHGISGKNPKILNLFAYTGGASIASALAGAHVTHVDSSKGAIEWAKENAQASKLSDSAIRWIEEDAYKFVEREARRENTYDGIILDPPRFGRGSKGEVWKIEEDLPKLLDACKRILSPKPLFVLLNAYTADLSSLVLVNSIADLISDSYGSIESGELALKDSTKGRLLPSGIFARWSAF